MAKPKKVAVTTTEIREMEKVLAIQNAWDNTVIFSPEGFIVELKKQGFVLMKNTFPGKKYK